MKSRYKKEHILLDEMPQVTGLHRKSIIRLMNDPSLSTERKPRTRERSPLYGAMVKDAPCIVARALDYPAAERLKPTLLSTARHLANFWKLELTEQLLGKLDKISLSTLRRMLASIPRDKPRHKALPQAHLRSGESLISRYTFRED